MLGFNCNQVMISNSRELFDLPLPNSIPGLYRVVCDDGFMYRNIEFVFYGGEEVFINSKKEGQRPLLIRPILASENLNTKYRGELADEKSTEITSWLDSFYELIADVRLFVSVGMSPTNAISRFIENRYYDCMSSGMPILMIRLLRSVIDNSQIEKDETMTKFMVDTEKHKNKTPELLNQMALQLSFKAT